MIYQTIRFTRPSVDVPFYETPPDIQQVQRLLKDEGYYFDTTFERPSELEMLFTWYWKSAEDRAFVREHPVIAQHIKNRNAYNAANGIIKECVYDGVPQP